MTAEETKDIEGRIRMLAAEHFKIDLESVRPDSRLKEDLGADSLDFVLLAYEVEDAFHIVFPDDAVTGVRTIGDAVSVVVQARQA